MGFFTALLNIISHESLRTGGWDRSARGSPTKQKKHKPEFQDPITNLTKSFIDNVFADRVIPTPGSIVYCDLPFASVEHSGIYVGRNRIVHLNGNGIIEKVTPQQFMNRLDGLNTAISIYVSCKNGNPVSAKSAATYARSMIGKKQTYNLLTNNCHHFTSSCISGSRRNSYGFLYLIKQQAERDIDCDEWRVWKI